MSKLLDELLRNTTAARYVPNWVSAFINQGEVTIHFADSSGQVMMRTNASYTSDVAESVGRAEFDAALKQYPSSTQGEIVQPEPNHAVLGRISEALECAECNVEAKVKKLLRESNAHKGARVKLREALGIGQGVDVYAHIEQLRKDRELLKARNREIVKLNDSLADLANYVHETFYADTGKLVLMKDVDMRLDQLACHVRGIPSVNAAESALTGLLDKIGCKGTDEALEKFQHMSTRLKGLTDERNRWHSAWEHADKKLVEILDALGVDGDFTAGIEVITTHQIASGSATLGGHLANILHVGQLYRNATVLLRTEQLIVWRDADEQEHSAPAHQVTLNPDDNGLAAVILSRIVAYEVAPEHIAEMRQQMGWVDEA